VNFRSNLHKAAAMAKRKLLAVAVFLNLCILSFTIAAAVSDSSVRRLFDAAAIDRFIAMQVARHHVPGLALAITQGDQVVFVRGYGLESELVPVSGNTQFRIASLSKSFTAMAVLQLVEANLIDLDAPIKRYLPDFALADSSMAMRITVRQLLNQTSGLADKGFIEGLNGQQETLKGRVASLGAARSIDQPGSSFYYFDPNYQVLARLVEVISGQPFNAYLQQHVFEPLNMGSTVSALTSVPPTHSKHLAQGHVIGYGIPLVVPELSGFLGGSGGVISTAADMANYLIAQGNQGRYKGGRVLSASSMSLIQTPPSDLGSSYAMGWISSYLHDAKTIEHNGVLSSYFAEAVLLPENGYGFVLLYNAYALTAATLAYPEIKSGMISILTGQTPVLSKITLPLLGRTLAIFSVVIVSLAIWGLKRLPPWEEWAVSEPLWKLGWSVLWPLTPTLLLLGLPRLLVLQTDRYFDPVMLLRAMPELIIFMGICAALGLTISLCRFAILCCLRLKH
jgi:CubicO group peptidase (beta-lactamase class C family)